VINCDYCVYWVKEHSGWGWCRRNAPSPVTTTGLPTKDTFAVYGFWPMTNFEDECGEGSLEQKIPGLS
jgi:hypothetical protein